MNRSSQSLRAYLKLASIYDGNSNKKETDFVEMVVYGCITNKLNKEPIKDISINKTHNILKEKDIIIKSLNNYFYYVCFIICIIFSCIYYIFVFIIYC